jgi:hypothetical protein
MMRSAAGGPVRSSARAASLSISSIFLKDVVGQAAYKLQSFAHHPEIYSAVSRTDKAHDFFSGGGGGKLGGHISCQKPLTQTAAPFGSSAAGRFPSLTLVPRRPVFILVSHAGI